MKFRAHDTFYIRKGWLYKGMKNVERDPLVFMGAQNNPMDVLGIGSNMVKVLQVFYITNLIHNFRRYPHDTHKIHHSK